MRLCVNTAGMSPIIDTTTRLQTDTSWYFQYGRKNAKKTGQENVLRLVVNSRLTYRNAKSELACKHIRKGDECMTLSWHVYIAFAPGCIRRGTRSLPYLCTDRYWHRSYSDRSSCSRQQQKAMSLVVPFSEVREFVTFSVLHYYVVKPKRVQAMVS